MPPLLLPEWVGMRWVRAMIGKVGALGQAGSMVMEWLGGSLG
jgi:hypothetical protein